jgi:hypothetical protein
VLAHIPLLVDILEVATELRTTWITLLVGKVLPQLLIEELVDWSIGVNTRAWIAVPVES